jgi:hypothetical protein
VATTSGARAVSFQRAKVINDLPQEIRRQHATELVLDDVTFKNPRLGE